MSKLRDFIEKIPEICGASYPKQRGKMFTLTFDHEMDVLDSVFKKEEFNNIEDRIGFIFDFVGDEKAKAYCKDLLILKMLHGYESKDKDELNVEINEVEGRLASATPPEGINFSVEDARSSHWP